MTELLTFLESYKGRDRFLRLFCYLSKCAAGLTKSQQTASRYDNLSKQLSTSRACFRLLDDIPTLKSVWDNLKENQDKTLSHKAFSYFENGLDVLFNIVDHMSWAIEHRIILSNSSIWDLTSTACWVISLYINLWKIAFKLSAISEEKLKIEGQIKKRDVRNKILVQQWNLQLSAIKCLSDLMFAVNYLPKGVLWAPFFNKWQVGAFGSISSLVSLYQSLLL